MAFTTQPGVSSRLLGCVKHTLPFVEDTFLRNTMARFTAFEGPHKTLFLFERDALRILTDSGGEALLPLRDCLALFARLSSHPVPWISAGMEALKGTRETGRRLSPDHDPDEENAGALSSGETLLLFDNDSVLVLGAEATEARVSLEDLRALLDHLVATPPISTRRGLQRTMPPVHPPSEVPLLSPSEWLVFRVVQEASSPLTIRQIASRWPSLDPSSLRGIVERLVGRQLLCARGSGWVAIEVDVSALVDRMLDHWMASHALTSPEQLSELVRLLDDRISRAVPPH